MTRVTEDGGRENIYAIEPTMEIMKVNETHDIKAERLNGRLAMLAWLGFLAQSVITNLPPNTINNEIYNGPLDNLQDVISNLQFIFPFWFPFLYH